MKIFAKIGLPMWALLAFSVPAESATLFDTGAPPPTASESVLASYQYLAAQFSLSSDSILSRVEGYISGGYYPPYNPQQAADTVYVKVYDNTNALPGTELFSTAFLPLSNYVGWQGADVSWSLAAGTYWLAFEAAGNTPPYLGMAAAFPAVVNGAFASSGYNDGMAYHSTFSSISIRGFDDAAAAAVPEPATWAMMLVGFGLVGTLARRRNLRPSFS